MTEIEKELLRCLRSLMSNKHVDLGDLVYMVREREGDGWEGESVKQYGKAVSDATLLMEKYKDVDV